VGGETGVSPVTFPIDAKREAYLIGKVDRVDVWEKEDEIYVKVVDYKSGKKTFSQKDLEKGQNVQLPLYLFALCDENQEGFREALGASPEQEILPAGALYLSSLIDPVEIFEKSYDKNAVLCEAEESITRSGFLVSDEDVLKALDSELSPQYLCGAKADKNGQMKGSSLISSTDMNMLDESLKKTITDIASTMTSGLMNAEPSVANNQYRCENCKMRAVCRARRKN
jgi:ATP-dependent helicase/nuclease subunit B